MKFNSQNSNFAAMTDEELVQFIVHSSNTNLFGILYDRYAQKVYGKCLGFAESRDVAEDLTQDIFVKLYLNLKNFRGESKFSTWLYSFAYNHCVNYSKLVLKKKRNEEVLDDENQYALSIEDEISDEEIFSLSVDKLQESLVKLDPEDKIVLLMKYQDDKSIKEIATLLDLGESAVKMRLHRAKKKIVEIYNSL
ncbi:RNA polymerase sigma factor [Myroides marinus]|jgi:RNA polymerase sigma-70 factor (ECF subfamily)|uniref:RNA polymerase sigma-70 factor, ECF subfamily n=1 Tax=Myroides marinus TaxID=703342 RepID=A0A165QL17_9FLAO|nr:RNA polymerase sigma factor [Myroides marinus]MDR0195478.1 RNA polymerase sigma factor [Myroides sp.]KUF37884.1 RNA polymerase subunit sigma-70 [Myroides marinus]KZE75444.1 RNA polymerase subunit sigma-70 [Myroides marinus]MDM1348619.1 RNA polymerase sigma factor [Myroides marinus]MDM1352259.1 RNA polymerase sigma factor [Myroides marinus]